MDIEMKLIKISVDNAERLWEMQVKAFQALYEKYQDTETSPATEEIDKIIVRLKQPFTYYYFMDVNGIAVGAVRVVDKKDGRSKKISPIFIMPEYRNKGYAQKAIKLAEEIHGSLKWELETILQERGNCYLYEKLGYRKAGKPEKISDKMTLILYKKE